jgi:hypothetical protein
MIVATLLPLHYTFSGYLLLRQCQAVSALFVQNMLLYSYMCVGPSAAAAVLASVSATSVLFAVTLKCFF